MSLISFNLYKEMARPRYPAGRRGKDSGDSSDVSRIPLNMDKEDIDFLNQFEHKDWGKAQQLRQDYFSKKILPKVQKAIDSKVKGSGLEDSLFYYLKNGKQPSSNPLSDEVVEYIHNHFHVREGRGIDVPMGTPDQVRQLVDGIKSSLNNFEKVGKSHLLGERRKEVLDLLGKAKDSGYDTSHRESLIKAYRELRRDDKIEDLAESILFEVFKKQVVDNAEFWKKEGLDPDTIEFDFTDGRTSSAKSGDRNIQVKKPHFFRYYHKLERTRGEPHLPELQKILGPVGKYGYDLSNPVEDKDAVTTTGTMFGSKATNKRWDRFVKDWLQHYSHGHFGSHIGAKFAKDVVWMPVTVAGHVVEDPLYDWMLDTVAKDILKDFKTSTNDEGEKRDWRKETLVGQDDVDCFPMSKDGNRSYAGHEACARIKAEKIMMKMVEEGKLFAPPVPCNSEFQKDCPTKEQRMYTIKDGKVVKPAVYLPHQRTGEGKYNLLVNPSTYLRQLEKESDGYDDLVQKAKEEMGEMFPGEHTYKVGQEERSVRFPIWAKHDIGDDETLNMGASDFKTFGPSFNKVSRTQNYINPNSKKGREIIQTYLQREAGNMVPDFAFGIKSCLGGSKCAAAPEFITNAMKGAIPEIHEIVYGYAMDDLLAMVPSSDLQDPSSEEEGSEGKDMTRIQWARSKTSNIAQNLKDLNLDVEYDYSRRKGVRVRNVAAPQDQDGAAMDFGDVGFDKQDSKRGRGLPTGSGLNKDARRKSIADIVSKLSSQDIMQIKHAGHVAQAATKAAISQIQTNLEDPWDSLKKKVSASALKREEFNKSLASILLSSGKSEEEVEGIINNFKDESIESIIKIMTGEGGMAAAKPQKPKALPIAKPVKPQAGPSAGGGLLDRLKQIRAGSTPSSVPSTPTAPPDSVEKDPKVDWVKFSNLTISERVEYLKNKLKS